MPFWRSPTGISEKEAWYDNPSGTTAHKSLDNDPRAMRWALLLGKMQACSVGQRVESRSDVEAYLTEIANTIQGDRRPEQAGELSAENSPITYVLYTSA